MYSSLQIVQNIGIVLTLALHSSMYVTLKPQPFARTSAPLVEAMRDPIMAGTLYRSPICRCSPIGY